MRKLIPPFLFSAYHWTLARLAAIIFWFPSRSMIIIGVTGTDGKTTTSYMIHHLLESAGIKSGLISTVMVKIGGKSIKYESDLTTPGRFTLSYLLFKMKRAGCKVAIIETSSEGLIGHRVDWIDFDVAVFTNLAPEHLNTHKTFQRYKEAKGKLFSSLAISKKKNFSKTSVVNFDDKEAGYFHSFWAEEKRTYALNEKADFNATEISVFNNRNEFIVGSQKFIIPHFMGIYNIYNALAAISTVSLFGVSIQRSALFFKNINPLSGRMNQIEEGQDFFVFVDFAHTPQGLESVLRTVKSFAKGKTISVFGSAGGRDANKRPDFGRVAARYSDFTILTTDDPRMEDPQNIAKDIALGLTEAGKKEDVEYIFIKDRKKAIERAIEIAQTGDVVITTGIGHHRVLYVGKGTIPWNEEGIAREAIRKKLTRIKK